ncbi:PapD-like protein [Phascolomyces articulosus]|uniref:PapD-like protein n=1 Tax=Phascolomyces articulosus TaxID=60185 RepID=A0AAD5JYV9_9FUNG|nr:PapD-like protein [Phascolomyces articulosus]
MSVLLEPSTHLTFTRPFSHPVATETISIENPSKVPISFKVKTTAPKQYCVKPNTGRIEPNERIQVQESKIEGYECKDKFLIQTTEIKPIYKDMNLTEMWQQIESEEKEPVYRHKLKCILGIPPTKRRQSEPLKEKLSMIQQHPSQVLRRDTTDSLPMKDAPTTLLPMNSSSSTSTSTEEEEENLMHQQQEERVVAVQEENARLTKQVKTTQEAMNQLRQELLLATRQCSQLEQRCLQYKEALLQDLADNDDDEEEESDHEQDKEKKDQEMNEKGEIVKEKERHRKQYRRERLAYILEQENKQVEGHPIAVAWTAAALTFGIAFYVLC